MLAFALSILCCEGAALVFGADVAPLSPYHIASCHAPPCAAAFSLETSRRVSIIIFAALLELSGSVFPVICSQVVRI